MELDRDLFRLTGVLDSLMRGYPRLIDIDLEKVIREIRFDSSILNVLYSGIDYNIEEVYARVLSFSRRVMDELKDEERLLIEKFYDELRLDTDVLSSNEMLNLGIESHPMILRALEVLSKE